MGAKEINEMKRKSVLSTIIGMVVLLTCLTVKAQSNSSVEVRKFELAADFSTITYEAGQSEVGFGGRLAYNLNSHIALEAAGYLFPDCQFCSRRSGQTMEGLFGVKIGKRFDKWGIFGKARPGVISSSQGQFETQSLTTAATIPPSFFFTQKRLTNFAADIGGVVEFYPSKRIITRLDFGSTIIHYGRHTINFPVFDPVTGAFTLQPSTTPAQNRGTLQLMAGVGFRF
jgi:hypothetical protein